jgi:diguanylate cyclase (GGDEF)-like protein
MSGLDAFSMRLEMGVVLLSALVLCVGATYRSTRARYVGLWCVALVVLAAASVLSLGGGTAVQGWTLPAASALMVLGATIVWRAARSLDGGSLPPAVHVVLPGFVLAVCLVGDPAEDVWTGAWALYLGVALGFGGAAVAMWSPSPTQAGRMRRATAGCGAVVAGYYSARLVALVAVGPDSRLFLEVFGFQMTTVVLSVLLVGATFSMSALTYEQERNDLRVQATTDTLTGLLNRTAFVENARSLKRDTHRRGVRCSLVLADLDRFKDVNDHFGHDVGDRVLVAFADACRARVRALDVVGRYGGEEFGLLLAGADADGARRVLESVQAGLSTLCAERGLPPVTASFGVVDVPNGAAWADMIVRADAALYAAKAAGRATTVVAV